MGWLVKMEAEIAAKDKIEAASKAADIAATVFEASGVSMSIVSIKLPERK